MKKFLLTLCAVAVMLTACIKKPGEPVETIKHYKIEFKIGGLNHTVGEPNVGFPTEPIQNFVKQLSIVAYNTETGAEVARQTHLPGTANFGKISFELPSGTYNFVAIGSNTEFGINQFYEADKNNPVYSTYPNANFHYWQPSFSFLDKYYKTSDTFFAKTTGLQLNKNQTAELIMERIVGLLTVIVTDKTDYAVDLQNDYSAYRFDTQVPFGVMENDFMSGYKQSKNGTINYYLLRSSGINLNIEAPVTKSITVSVPKNKHTTLRIQFETMTVNTTVE
ncbi:hypothetical protein [Pedobacter sp.]|uniref:hypothetical protein n=1 Tax=Pedobacter sp. TaxID=1411316 RepID=UPI003BAD995F